MMRNFMIFTLTKYYQGEQTRKNKKGGPCGRNMGEQKMRVGFCSKNSGQGEGQIETLPADEETISKLGNVCSLKTQ